MDIQLINERNDLDHWTTSEPLGDITPRALVVFRQRGQVFELPLGACYVLETRACRTSDGTSCTDGTTEPAWVKPPWGTSVESGQPCALCHRPHD
ncbi:hypothetical protein LSAT2_005134, partial [Lamellibrachia satsuma]